MKLGVVCFRLQSQLRIALVLQQSTAPRKCQWVVLSVWAIAFFVGVGGWMGGWGQVKGVLIQCVRVWGFHRVLESGKLGSDLK